MEISPYLLLFLSALAFSNLEQISMASGSMHKVKTENIQAVKGIIGAIVDHSTRVGKEEIVAMNMAVEDVYNQIKQKVTLLVKNSRGKAVQATLAARDLIQKQVQVILGPRSWEETSSVAELGSQYGIPTLSFADSCPSWATERWPFFIQASPSKNLQMKAVAAMAQSWGWRQVNVIYEDTDSAVNGITPHLYDALQEVGAQISHLTALPSFANASMLCRELEKLKLEQCRVFVVHASSTLAEHIFSMAKAMKMMEQGYVWITTDTVTSLVHSMDFSTMSSMQGVLGVERYYHDKGRKYQDFYGIFHYEFGLKYPKEKNHEPGISALEAYDAIWTVALAMKEGKMDHQHLLDKLSITDFSGLSGKIQFSEQRLAPAVNTFRLINIVGRSYLELGFWSDGIGFSVEVGENAKNNISMEIFGKLYWPGGSPDAPRGWDIPTVANELRIGVPNASLIKRFVDVEYDPLTKSYTVSGFSIDVFKETVRYLPYFLPYSFIPFDGTYDALVEQVRLKNFDAAVGDIAIISKRYVDADFTQPHTESGLVLVVPIQSQSNRSWLFLKPFTKTMWFLTATINVYNGFVIWMIERNYCSELKGSPLSQIGTLLWLAFATLFSPQGEKLHSNLSRIATLVWLFVALIISQSYTASLTSILTVPRLEPKVPNVETLRNSNAVVGYSRKTFVKDYLLNVLQFNPNNIRNFSSFEECADNLKTGKTAGALLEVPTAKLFLARYCKSFMTTGSTYIFGGYGYAFPKGSALVAEMDEALLKVFEAGTLKDLEEKLTASEKCVENFESDNEILSLSPSSFCVLFLFTAGTSTAALAIYFVHSKYKMDESMSEHKRIWMLILMVLINWRNQKSQFSRRVGHAETSRDSPLHHAQGNNPENLV